MFYMLKCEQCLLSNLLSRLLNSSQKSENKIQKLRTWLGSLNYIFPKEIVVKETKLWNCTGFHGWNLSVANTAMIYAQHCIWTIKNISIELKQSKNMQKNPNLAWIIDLHFRRENDSQKDKTPKLNWSTSMDIVETSL